MSLLLFYKCSCKICDVSDVIKCQHLAKVSHPSQNMTYIILYIFLLCIPAQQSSVSSNQSRHFPLIFIHSKSFCLLYYYSPDSPPHIWKCNRLLCVKNSSSIWSNQQWSKWLIFPILMFDVTLNEVLHILL